MREGSPLDYLSRPETTNVGGITNENGSDNVSGGGSTPGGALGHLDGAMRRCLFGGGAIGVVMPCRRPAKGKKLQLAGGLVEACFESAELIFEDLPVQVRLEHEVYILLPRPLSRPNAFSCRVPSRGQTPFFSEAAVILHRQPQTTNRKPHILKQNSQHPKSTSHQLDKAMQMCGGGSYLRGGDWFVTRHSNLASCHVIFHIVVDDAPSSTPSEPTISVSTRPTFCRTMLAVNDDAFLWGNLLERTASRPSGEEAW